MALAMNFFFFCTFVLMVFVFAFRERQKLQFICLLAGLWLLVAGVLVSNMLSYQIDNYSYHVEQRLIDSIVFVESYEAEMGHLPTRSTFEEWVNHEHPNWGIVYFLHEGDQESTQRTDETTNQMPYYRVSAWNGDESKIYDSFGNQFRYDFAD